MRFKPSLLVVVVLLLAALALAISPALAATPSFSDVPSYHPYALAIQDLATQEIINGFPDGTFKPDNPVTRQQFAKVILLSFSILVSEDAWPNPDVPFVDLGPDDPNSLYPHEYVATAAVLGITKGKDLTHFAPLDNISRAQVITMVVRAAQNILPETVSLAGDVATSTWGNFDATHASNAAIAEANGLLAGLGADASHPSGNLASLSPFAKMTRGEVAQVLHNLIERIDQTATPMSSETSPPSSETTTTSPPTTGPLGDLTHFYWTAADGWKAENVSALTGTKVWGPPVHVFNLAGSTADGLITKGPDHSLYAFSKTNLPNWLVLSDTEWGGKDLAGPLTTWYTSDNSLAREFGHLAGPAKDGDLLHILWGVGSDQPPFEYEDVSSTTGQKIQGEISAYVTFSGNDLKVEHVAARSLSGDLLVFSDVALLQNWQVVDVSVLTGRTIVGSPVAWVEYLTGDVFRGHVAGVGTDGHLLHFYWTAADNWKVEDVSAKTGVGQLAGPVVQWGMRFGGMSDFDGLAAVDTADHLQHFWRTSGSPDWFVEDVSAATGRQALGPLAFYYDTLASNYYEHVVAEGSDGHLLIFWDNRVNHDWKVVDVTAITGASAEGPFATWFSYDQGLPVMTHLAGVRR
jgi:hypothetical protein